MYVPKLKFANAFKNKRGENQLVPSKVTNHIFCLYFHGCFFQLRPEMITVREIQGTNFDLMMI